MAGKSNTVGIFCTGLSATAPHGPAGGAVDVDLIVNLPAGTTINTYWKFGPEPADPTPHWYEFLFDGTTGATISGNVIGAPVNMAPGSGTGPVTPPVTPPVETDDCCGNGMDGMMMMPMALLGIGWMRRRRPRS